MKWRRRLEDDAEYLEIVDSEGTVVRTYEGKLGDFSYTTDMNGCREAPEVAEEAGAEERLATLDNRTLEDVP